MKIRSLFDLLQDAREVTSFFEEVTSQEQMISRLERLKKLGSQEFLETIDGLRLSCDTLLEDMFEVGSVGLGGEMEEGEGEDEGEGDGDGVLSEAELASITAELESMAASEAGETGEAGEAENEPALEKTESPTEAVEAKT